MPRGYSFNQTILDRNTSILSYLKKYDGDWKNRREINTHSGRDINRKTLDEILEGFVERGLVLKREAENPQAKLEFKITDKGKQKLAIALMIQEDSDMSYMAGLKREKFDQI